MTRSDPWAVGTVSHRPSTPVATAGRGRVASAAVLWTVLGSFGPALQAWFGGTPSRVGVLVILATGLAVSAALQLRHLALRVLGAGAASAAGVGLGHLNVGSMALVVSVIGVCVARSCITGRRPWERVAAGDESALLAVPVLAAAELGFRRGWGPGPAVALMAVALVVVEWYRLRPQAAARPDRLVRSGVRRLTNAVGAIATFVSALIVLYAPALALAPVTGVLRRRAESRPTEFRAGVGAVGQQRLDHGRPFATAPASRRTAARVAAVVMVAAAIVTVAVVRSHARATADASDVVTDAGSTGGDGSATSGAPDDGSAGSDDTPIEQLYSKMPAGAGAPWIDEVQKEHQAVPLPPGPVAGYSIGDYATTYTNVKDGERSTLAPPPCDCRPYRVWFTGGSVAFGVGQRDDHTIASELVRDAAANGATVEVHNIAVPGYTLWQEYQAILARLASGEAPPDAIIFYDGFNDLIQTYVQAIVEEPDFSQPAVFDPSALASLRSSPPDDIRAVMAKRGGAVELGRKAGDRYRTLQQLVTRQLSKRVPTVRFFFQPDATVSARQRATGLQAYSVVTPAQADEYATFADAATAGLPGDVTNLRHVFDDVEQPVFLDIAHTNEAGAAIVAGRIERAMRPIFTAGR